MQIQVDDVPLGTYKFRIFSNEDGYKKESFIISGLIEPDGRGGCEITQLHGDASNESNELMALTVKDLGFTYLTFKTLRGTKVTHYAEHLRSDQEFDYYIVMLEGNTTDDGRG